ncbi:Not1-domain-containing protein [Basidiobolus meristosporus CBS 931.73]|uniref:General negative regulator of transcription subunit 1 n=1 Tax=Basidiobolus meristosporus CBS 931.73 TaxID=1314790 RepID=A0A1Y1Z992_9FUNG|nr:Not1-domain-containing protein [Basidiobolus meristosporus CBS 931.73]|eukprot:ORY06821.1 Not1-domain-containing protein [Basidiobolus meristosporus CBS 931.73]
MLFELSQSSQSSKTSHPFNHSSELLQPVRSRIQYLLSLLDTSNYNQVFAELSLYFNSFGRDIYVYLFQDLFVQLQQSQNETDSINNKESTHLKLLSEQLSSVLESPTLVGTLFEAVYSIPATVTLDIESLSRKLQLNPIQSAAFSLALESSTKTSSETKSAYIQKQIDGLNQLNPSEIKGSENSLKLVFHYFTQINPKYSLNRTTLDEITQACLEHDIIIANMSDTNSQEKHSALAQKIKDLGPSCCKDTNEIGALFKEVGLEATATTNIISEADIAKALGAMAAYTAQGLPTTEDNDDVECQWNIEGFITVLMDLQPNTDWLVVIQQLDHDGFYVPSVAGLSVITSAYKSAVKGSSPFPLDVLWHRWNNTKGQLSFLRQAIQAPIEVIDIAELATKKIVDPEDVASTNPQFANIASNLVTQPWNNLDLIQNLIFMYETEVGEEVKSLFERGTKQTPELLLLGLAQLPEPWNPLHQELVTKLVAAFLTGHMNSNFVLWRLWNINNSLLIHAALDMYHSNPTLISRILDVAQDIKILKSMLEVQPFFFAIDLAALACRREYLNLEKWLQDSIATHGEPFLRVCFEFLTQKMGYNEQAGNGATQTVPLSLEVISIFLKVIGASATSADTSEKFKELQTLCFKKHPELASMGNNSNPTTTSGEVSFSPDVEEEANMYYEKIYKEELSVESMIELLHRLKNSRISRERDVFDCMMHNLFDEFKFFPKYPPKELSITSNLIGSLIQHQLVSYIPLGVALKCVLDALCDESSVKMFNFGVQALVQFKARLIEWPQYCSHLLQIPKLQQAHPEIMQYIKANLGQVPSTALPPVAGTNAVVEQPLSDKPQVNSAPEPSKNEALPAFTSLNLDPLFVSGDGSDNEVPPESVQDKILFIINNVAHSNMETKVQEMKDVLKESAFRWFGHYLVVKRASIEPNNHQLYLQFLDSLNSDLLYRYLLHETFANIKVLLNSEKTVQSSSERSLLKNLGSWLGGMTLARNKPIKHKNIAFKELLVEGYDSNRLIVAIPFVCKVLEQCGKSRVFKPPNPWLIAIMRLLVELYQFADLKLNLKFEIEVLCKSLNLDIKDIEPTTILKDRPPKDFVSQSNVVKEMEKLSIDYDTSSRAPTHHQMLGQAQQSNSQRILAIADDALGAIIPTIAPYISVNPNLPLNQAVLKRVVHIAMDQALRETVGSTVERSVKIARFTTQELITKDFAMEPNEEKMRKAAHLMVQNLAASLAVAASKDNLRSGIATHLRSMLLQNGVSEQAFPDQALSITVTDNLDLASSVVEKVAMEVAILQIDEGLANSYASRKKHREFRTGQPFYDAAVVSTFRYPPNLPDALRLKPNGLLPQQLVVYEDFARIPRFQSQLANVYDERSLRTAMPVKGDAYGYDVGYESAPPTISAHQALEKFSLLVNELDKQLGQCTVNGLAAIPQQHDIRVIVHQIQALASHSNNRDETALTFSQKVVQSLYKGDTNLAREVYVHLLERLCDLSPSVAKEVTAWLIYADDERKYNVPVTVALIKVGLINLPEQDAQLAKLIDVGRPSVIEFAVKLIAKCVLDDSCATHMDFSASLDALTRLTQRGKSPSSVIELLEEIHKQGTTTPQDTEIAQLREQLTFMFIEWVKLYQHVSSNEKAFATFAHQLQQRGVLKDEDVSSLFFRVCTEISVEGFLKYSNSVSGNGPIPAAAYQGVDAFSKLIVVLVKYYNELTPVNPNLAKITFLSKILSIILLVLVHDHQQHKGQFNQKPYLRLFTNLLSDFNSYEQQLQPIYYNILTALANTFHSLQPSFLPGFAFAWISLISHRLFMPKLLLAENQKGWPAIQRLMICLFKFIGPLLEDFDRESTRALYKGTMRVLLVLLHDFPEFLCDYHFSFCDVIPPTCIQTRNVILSAFPRNMRLPDPFTPNLKVDLLPEISQSPHVLSDYSSSLLAGDFKQDIDTYLKTRGPVSFLLDLRSRLMAEPNEEKEHTGPKYNVPVINSLVLYVGTQAIAQLQNKTHQGTSPITHSAPMDIFQQLLIDLDSEGRYLFLSAIANQLRYPNNHTHYFSCVLLYLFAEGSQESIKEQVTRVLLERLIVNRPHPWGLLITFIELIKNPRYNFWSHSFTRCAPDIESLFDSVARSINV